MKEAIKFLIKRYGGYFLTPPGVDWMVDVARMTRSARPVETIFDVGANIGQTSRSLSRAFPTSSIWAFEPVAASFGLMAQNLSQISAVTPVQVALGSHIGKAKARIAPECNLVNALLKPGDEESGPLEEVAVDTIDAFCLKQNIAKIDILKSDTEGYDLEVLKGGDEMLSTGKIRFVYVEVRFPGGFEGLTPFDKAFETLACYNFRFLGLYEVYPMQHYPEDRSYCNALFVHRDALK